MSINSDGNKVAIGAYRNNTAAGHVRIYDWNGSSWTQRGQDIDGEPYYDYSGYSVSINSDGNKVAIGAYRNDSNGTTSGHVRIYDWNGFSWTQRGHDIDGEAPSDYSGYSVSLSSDGNKVGAYGNDGNGTDAGHVRIYNLNYQPCDGCTDPLALNYDSTVQYDDGSCIYPQGCTDSLAYNYDSGAITDDGTCLYCDLSITLQVYENSSALSCDGLAIVTSYSTSNSPISYLWSNGSTLNNISSLCPGFYSIIVTDSVACSVLDSFYIGAGCTDSIACNYDSLITFDDGSCSYIFGCMDSLSFNYNPDACIDSSCIPFIFGCTDSLETMNYNPSANTDDGSCCYTSGFSEIPFDSISNASYSFSHDGEIIAIGSPENNHNYHNYTGKVKIYQNPYQIGFR